MSLNSCLLILCWILVYPAVGQERNVINWQKLDDGLWFCEMDAPEKSVVNDSKLTLLKVDPLKCRFSLLSSSEHGRINRTAEEWAGEFNMKVVINAGMYNIANGKTNKGYLKNYSHYNNRHFNRSYNVMMALNPKKKSSPSLHLFDLTHTPWDSIRLQYHSFCQGMRMIDWKGEPLAWDKRPGQSCSMVICGTDSQGVIYFFFTRSPYTHQQMIRFLLNLPINIRTTAYLEGGPEASLYIQAKDTTIVKFGSYISNSRPRDDNDHFFKIPNVLGIEKNN